MKKLFLFFGVLTLVFQSCEVNEIDSQEEISKIDFALLRASECKCHESGFFKCNKETQVTIGSKPEITTINVDYESKPCKKPGSWSSAGEWEEDESGCGWFWMERCDGTC